MEGFKGYLKNINGNFPWKPGINDFNNFDEGKLLNRIMFDNIGSILIMTGLDVNIGIGLGCLGLTRIPYLYEFLHEKIGF